jgi:MtN3 and saliva related transmembrane protein
MDSTTILAFLAGSFGVAMGASPLLQALRASKRRSSEDISLGFLLVLLAGGSAWLAYGLAIGNPALIIGNSIGVLSSATALLVAWHWRREPIDRAKAEAFRT